MASITGKTNLFFVTSPRSPEKMIEELELLIMHFNGEKWDKKTQKSFANKLSESDFYFGNIKENDDFSARDRINRAPKGLGFVDLKPKIRLSEAGKEYIENERKSEIFTRQILKFQLPSPYHIDKNFAFNIKPYLELIRLCYELNGLTKDEIKAFFMGLIHYSKYDEIKEKILNFREEVKKLDRNITSYKLYYDEIFEDEINSIYGQAISSNKIKTREQNEVDLKQFIKTKKSNHADYADAAIRYLRATELFEIEPGTYNLIVAKEKEPDVKFILEHTIREVHLFKTENEYKNYLFDAQHPTLLEDDKEGILSKILSYEEQLNINKGKVHSDKSLVELKKILFSLEKNIKEKNLTKTIYALQNFKEFGDVQKVYDDIVSKKVVDAPVYMEWNTWRSFAMLGFGEIIGNFKTDLSGLPLRTAMGKMPDILCEYDDFDVIVEVTLSTGEKQYEMEGESISRHLAVQKAKNLSLNNNKKNFCIFIPNKINPSTLAHIYTLHFVNTKFHNGNLNIIPLNLSDFRNLLEYANANKSKINSNKIKNLLESISNKALSSTDEENWYRYIREKITNWL